MDRIFRTTTRRKIFLKRDNRLPKIPLTCDYPDYLLGTSSPSDYSSKKAAIIDLIEYGYSNKEIASRTRTSKEYVAKIRSLRKSAQSLLHEVAPFTDQSSFTAMSPDETGNENANNRIQTDTSSNDGREDRNNNDGEKRDIRRTGKETIPPKRLLPAPSALGTGRDIGNHGQGGYYYNDPVGKEVRKILWNAFDAKVSIVDIIKEHGFVPEMVEREYNKFLRAKGVSPTEMQGVIICKINESRDIFAKILPKEKVEEYDKIIESYNANGSISTDQFSNLMEIYRQIEFFKGKKSILTESVSEPLIGGWVRPKCWKCGKQLQGIIYDANKDAVEYIKEITVRSGDWEHYWACPAD